MFVSRLLSSRVKLPRRRSFVTSCPRLASALFLTGQKASETYAPLTPHVDGDAKLRDLESLEKNVVARGLKVDVRKLKDHWDDLKTIKESKLLLEAKRVKTTHKIKSLVKESNEKSASEVEVLKVLGVSLRKQLKKITRDIWDLEERVVLSVLALPNEIHPETPLDGEVVLLDEGGGNHTEIEQGAVILCHNSRLSYYLEESAAEFELALLQHTAMLLIKNGFLQTSNSDLVKSVIVEGVGLNHHSAEASFVLQPTDSLTIDDSRTHLVGGASLASFCALFAKREFFPEDLPVMVFTVGRSYSPPSEPPPTASAGLLDVSQSSCVDVFSVSTEGEEDEQHRRLVEQALAVYRQLGLHVRVVQCAAKDLAPCESLRTKFEMFSNRAQRYVEVGHVALHGTYISKRLRVQGRTGRGEENFLGLVSGRIASVPRVLACLSDKDGGFRFPVALKGILS